MIRWLPRLATVVVFGSSVALLSGQQGPSRPDDEVPGEIIVQFRPGTSQSERGAARGRERATLVRSFNRFDMELLRVGQGRDVRAAVAALLATPGVLRAQANYVRRASAAPNDPFWTLGLMWGLQQIKADEVWQTYTTGASDVVVADIDTGVNYLHPDLAANMWRNPGEIAGNGLDDDANGYVDDVHGIDVVNGDGDPMDDNGHGTHTSGTMAAVGNNGIGVTGVSWNSRIVACKFLDANGSGTDAGAIECLNYVLDLRTQGVNIRVTNNSYGAPRGAGPVPSALMAAFDAAGDAGVLNVVAAGNDGVDIDLAPNDPASLPSPSIVAVAASDTVDSRAAFSNWGAASVDIAAPGVLILSTVGDGYSFSDGTSMAAPHVSGAAALLAGMDPSLTVGNLRALLLATVDVMPQWTGRVASGGRLNVLAAAVGSGGNGPPSVALTSPANGTTFTAPAAIGIAAIASDIDGVVARVEFLANGVSIGTDTSHPFGLTWIAPAGRHTLTAVATDDEGATSTSQPVEVIVAVPAPATAAFVEIDATTQGNWIGSYGADGYNVVDDAVSYPEYAQVISSGHAEWTWETSTSDVRALQRAVGAGRVAATWYGQSFSVDLHLLDGQPHNVALYNIDWDSTARVQRVDIRNAETNVLLDSRTVSGFHGGQYLVWTLTGHVRIEITRVEGGNAVVSGLFLGPVTNRRPSVALTSPSAGVAGTAPATIALAATASDPDGSIAQVEFLANGAPIGVDTTSPYGTTWTGVPAGSYTLTAVATDDDGATSTSAPVAIVVAAPGTPTSAAFVGVDSSTQGSWLGRYGADGYNIVADAVSYPAYAQVAAAGQAPWIWSSSTTETRALQRPGGASRIAATWFGQSFGIDVDLVDGLAHDLAIYSLDWDGNARTQRFDVRDAQTNVLLDSRTIGSFNGGRYVVWTLTGHVRIDVTVLAGANAVVSGIFLDPPADNRPPTVTVTSPANGATFTAPATLTLTADARDNDGTVAQVEFFANGTSWGADTASPFSVSRPGVPPGAYTITAVATDDDGATTTSAAVAVIVTAAGAGTTAVFEGVDSSTQGNWIGVYGADGYNVIADAVGYPPYADVSSAGHGQWTWATSTTDVRALRRTVGPDRLAATWFGDAISMTVNLRDGLPHRIALYCLDWDSTTRSQRVDVRDAETNALLDSRTISSFNGGQYLIWTVSGRVRIEVTRLSGSNAVVSGLFFQAPQ